MVEPNIRREWEIRLKELNVKNHELKSRSDELEDEIEKLEGELFQDRIRKYRIELLNKLRKDFVRTFRERDSLIESNSTAATGEWNVCSLRLKACVVLQRALDTEESGFCKDVPQLKSFLRDKLNSELGDEAGEEILYFLES
jgi:predicted nuclease with TOPRIM domain